MNLFSEIVRNTNLSGYMFSSLFTQHKVAKG